ncbi:MAG: hypothetical protein COB02_06935 [Candidatus Cloacimonadota bacterium]|nr:MAG: hypothetical protein COB02_06935 [Candidatus Cloacimonadota bacterium]
MDQHHLENRRMYDRLGREYAEKRKSESQSFWNDQVELPGIKQLLSPLLKDSTFLDLACGPGLRTKLWQSQVKNYFASDFCYSLLAIAKEDHDLLGNWIQSDAESMPYKTETFDLVLSSLLLHYFQDLGPIFKEVARVLKPDGSFVFSFHHPFDEILSHAPADKFPVILRNYHDEKSYEWGMLNVSFTSFHHKIETIIKVINENGFFLDELLEPRPSKESESINPKGYAYTNRFPSFMAIKATKR